jgi:hypothetical protein
MSVVPLSNQAKPLALLGLLFVTLLGVSEVASAQQPTQAQANAIRQSCATDYRAHCASVPPGGSAALACLQHNAASASPGCQQALAAVGGEAAAPQTGQTQPNQTQPSQTQPSGTQTGQTPAGASSPPPAAAAPPHPLTLRQQALVLRQSCAPDYQRLCHGVPLGGGRAIACLDRHASALSPGCRNGLASMRQGG